MYKAGHLFMRRGGRSVFEESPVAPGPKTNWEGSTIPSWELEDPDFIRVRASAASSRAELTLLVSRRKTPGSANRFFPSASFVIPTTVTHLGKHSKFRRRGKFGVPIKFFIFFFFFYPPPSPPPPPPPPSQRSLLTTTI